MLSRKPASASRLIEPGGFVALDPDEGRSQCQQTTLGTRSVQRYWSARRGRRSSRHDLPEPRALLVNGASMLQSASLISPAWPACDRVGCAGAAGTVLPGAPTDMREPRKSNVSGLPSRARAVRRRERPNSMRRVLSGCSVNANVASRVPAPPEPLSIGLMLEADDDVIGIAHDDHVAAASRRRQRSAHRSKT